jgi:hypothetical protein
MALDFYRKMELGKIGENVVEQDLLAHGYLTYKATDSNSHPFDFFVLNTSTHRFCVVEVKYKKPLSTGRFCLYEYEKIRYINQKRCWNIEELWIAFVDPYNHNNIIWIEIEKNLPEKIIVDNSGKRLCLFTLENGGNFYANDSI